MEDGEIDYTDPKVHEAANPAYGASIRPEDIMNDALQAQNDPQQRKDFFAKSLNVYINSVKAYFDIEEFRRSDAKYDWTLDDLAKMNINWYGGADLSKLHDLTAAALFGNYKERNIIITHASSIYEYSGARKGRPGQHTAFWVARRWLADHVQLTNGESCRTWSTGSKT